MKTPIGNKSMYEDCPHWGPEKIFYWRSHSSSSSGSKRTGSEAAWDAVGYILISKFMP